MKGYPGVTTATRKDGTLYYRSSITIFNRHISLGSFDRLEKASAAYQTACSIMRDHQYHIPDYSPSLALDFSKFIILVNYRDNGLYFKTPIYLHKSYFYYYLTPDQYFIFDREDLFFYATHQIQSRGGYYFVCDYGSQYSILSRYGIHNYSQKGIDYVFVNQNEMDFRYENIRVINDYMGVNERQDLSPACYESIIHVRGNYLVGRYEDPITAAIAYNKAVDRLTQNGFTKKYIKNYITTYNSTQYHERYQAIPISPKIGQLQPDKHQKKD